MSRRTDKTHTVTVLLRTRKKMTRSASPLRHLFHSRTPSEGRAHCGRYCLWEKRKVNICEEALYNPSLTDGFLFLSEGGILWDDSATVQCRDSQQIYAPISNARFEEHTPAFQPVYGSEVHANNHVSGNSGYPARPPMIIRPITPSTLMALTEPCLMAWCSKSALDQRFPPVNVSVDGTEAINYMPPSGHSSWGY